MNKLQSQPKKYFLIAGESSGDLHGANLIKSIKSFEINSSFMGHGGDQMLDAGMEIFEHTSNLNIMGFSEIMKHLPRMFKIMGKTKELIKEKAPDKIILIDYPGFNLRLAKEIKNLKIPITYFILPQIWAWNQKRINLMKKYINQSISIIPFEKNWFESRGLPIQYVGHPFSEPVSQNETKKDILNRHGFNESDPILVLLPGSRQQEIEKHWPIFIKTVLNVKKRIPSLQVLVICAPDVEINKIPNHIRSETNTRLALSVATAAIVSSGTATLECAAENIPIVVCYKMSIFSWIIAKIMAKQKYISLVNLIANDTVVKEFLQYNLTISNLSKAITPLLDKENNSRSIILKKYKKIRSLLGKPGVYNRAAKYIIEK